MKKICQEYKQQTEDAYKKLKELISNLKTGSEDDLRAKFKEVIESFLQKINDKRPIFLEKKRIDILIGDIVVETKKIKKLSGGKAIEKYKQQTKKYMLELLSPYGILTDLNKIYFFELKDNKEIKEINIKNNNFNYDNFCYMLDLLLGERKRFFTEISLISDFGNVTQNKLIKDLLKKFYGLLQNSFKEESSNKKTKMFFLEWKKLFKLAETTNKEYLLTRRKALQDYFDVEINEENEYECLFAMHTILSLIVKLLVLSFLHYLNEGDGLSFENGIETYQLKNFFRKIETGETFRAFGIINMCNNDFFSWYVHENWDKELSDLLLSLKNRAMLYKHINESNPSLLKDALQKLYENFIPREIRHSFGEYYTPPSISDLMVQEAKKKLRKNRKYYRAIDPTCGSGTFLISLLKDKIQNNKENRSIREIIQEVVGIDLNPIATLMAKFNYLLSVYKQFKNEGNQTEIEIPVYLGDSSYVPMEENIDGIRCLTYEYYFPPELHVKFPKIVFPLDFVRSENFLPTIVEIEEKIGKEEKPETILNYLFKKIGEKNLNEKVKGHLTTLINCIIDYQKRNLNTIWLFIFMNYLKPFALPKFDLIIGNPPWVRWAVLPSEYKNKIKKTLRQEGIFSNDKNYGGVDLNICVLITYKVIENLANYDGLLAFLLPQGVLVNKSYEGFRKFDFGDKVATPELIYGFTKSFFGEEPIVLFLRITRKPNKRYKLKKTS